MVLVWVDQKESFYCALDECSADMKIEEDRNITSYNCPHINCKCVPGRMLCGENGSIDLGDFLEQEIKGPASFKTFASDGGSPNDHSEFSEPNMNELINSVFGDAMILLKCFS